MRGKRACGSPAGKRLPLTMDIYNIKELAYTWVGIFKIARGRRAGHRHLTGEPLQWAGMLRPTDILKFMIVPPYRKYYNVTQNNVK